MADRDPLRDHIARPPRAPRIESASSRPNSLSPRALMQYAAQHGRYWSPIGVALMFAGVIGSIVIAGEYTDAGKMLVTAWRANTAEVAALRSDLKRLEAKADKALAGNEAIREELRVQGHGNATKRIVVLEHNSLLTARAVGKINGRALNASWPRSYEGDFQRPVDAPEPQYPLFSTDLQWATIGSLTATED